MALGAQGRSFPDLCGVVHVGRRVSFRQWGAEEETGSVEFELRSWRPLRHLSLLAPGLIRWARFPVLQGLGDCFPFGTRRREKYSRGFTLVELLIVVAIILTLAALAVPSLQQARESARIAKAVADITVLEMDIETYQVTNGNLPNTLADVGHGDLLDSWGNPYQYLNFANTNGKGAMRKDRFLVPINSTYDLYSMGADGQSVPPITANVSQDDIIRANDGSYVGLASQY